MVLVISNPRLDGSAKLVAICKTHDDVRTFLSHHIQFTKKLSGELTPEFDMKYIVTEAEVFGEVPVVQTPPAPSESVDYPFHSFTVASETENGVYYGVSANSKGFLEGCTCPAFENYRDRGACKHMKHVAWFNPFGIDLKLKNWGE